MLNLIEVNMSAIELRGEVENWIDLRVPSVANEMRVLIARQIALLVDRDLKGGWRKFAAVAAGIELKFHV